MQAEQYDIQEPTVPRRRKVPRRYEVGSSTSSSSVIMPEDYYKPIYFEAFDTVIARIKDRFDQEGYHKYSKLEKLLMKKCDEESSDDVLDFYGDDFVKDDLLAQLDNFHANHSFDPGFSIHDVFLVFKNMSEGERALLKEVVKLARLILVLPATNAVSERSFSAMRRTKNYLRTTMSQQRFNSLMLLHINKDYTDKLDLCIVGNEFRDVKDYRKSKFPTFKA